MGRGRGRGMAVGRDWACGSNRAMCRGRGMYMGRVGAMGMGYWYWPKL